MTLSLVGAAARIPISIPTTAWPHSINSKAIESSEGWQEAGISKSCQHHIAKGPHGIYRQGMSVFGFPVHGSHTSTGSSLVMAGRTCSA